MVTRKHGKLLPAFIFALVCLTQACGRGLDPSCASAVDLSLPVLYGGAVQGEGLLKAAVLEGDRMGLTFEYRSGDGSLQTQMIGAGTCRDGVVRAQLAPSSTETEKLKVLGGAVVAVLNASPLAAPFGFFELEVVRKPDNERDTLVGFWRERSQPPK